MGKLLLEESTVPRTIIAEGRLMIQEAAELKAVLLDAGRSADDAFIDLTSVESLDLSCVQIFCSASKSYRKEGRNLGIKGILPEGVRQSIQDIGINLRTCDTACQSFCLWETGEER